MTPEASDLLSSLFVLAAWTAITWIIMTAVRLRAMTAAGMDPNAARHTSELASLPRVPRQMADNYNHLFEVPVLFYAVVLAIVAGGHADATHVLCAWVFVVSRIIHSFWQWTANVVLIRFLIFTVGWIAVMVMIVRELLVYFG